MPGIKAMDELALVTKENNKQQVQQDEFSSERYKANLFKVLFIQRQRFYTLLCAKVRISREYASII